MCKPTKCTNDIYFLNLLHLHISVTFDHHQGALLQSAVIQLYVHSYKIQLFTNMSSKTQPSYCLLTTEIKKLKSCFDMFKMSCQVSTWPPHSARTITQDILNISTQLFNFLFSIVNIQHDGWVLDDIFVNNCIFYECTYSWITALCNSAPWWWSKVIETCRCNKLRKYISFVHFVGFH